MCWKEMGNSVDHDKHERARVVPMATTWVSSKIPQILPSPVSFLHGSRGQEVPGGKRGTSVPMSDSKRMPEAVGVLTKLSQGDRHQGQLGKPHKSPSR